ncbi:GntR family transcriptional regulator [Pelagibacterium sp.]|uniref:GntR family transcriptional regulator n=1 Tax=Pelagibacterium sp. TaxID=1967288 RepID=UPI003A8DA6B8
MSKVDSAKKKAPARRERGATTVYQALREEILTLQREPGAGLDEVGIAKEFNLSRTPVREALFMLSGDGLVHVLQNRASIVAPLTMHRVNDLFDTWLILTRAVCVDAAHRRTSEDIVDLEDRLVQFEVAAEYDDMLATARALLHLQRGYGEVARNFFLGRYYPLCLDAGRRTLLLHYFPYAKADGLATQLDCHRAMIAAIRANDSPACNRIAGEMLAAILGVIKSSLDPSIADEVDLVTSPLSRIPGASK